MNGEIAAILAMDGIASGAIYVLIGLGMCARLLQLPQWAALLTTAGLALYFGARWHRRSGDR